MENKSSLLSLLSSSPWRYVSGDESGTESPLVARVLFLVFLWRMTRNGFELPVKV